MKKASFIILCFSLVASLNAIAQKDKTELKEAQKLPPFETLPKADSVKTIYQFQELTQYSLYDQKGKLVQEGRAEFVDMTKLPKGVYFFRYNGLSVPYKKTE
jgi:hypothetical protein